MSTFWPLLKLQFFGLKMIVFYLKYPKTIFSDIISVKKKGLRESSIFGQNPWTNNFKKCPLLRTCKKIQFLGLKMIVFYLRYPKTIFSHMISVKNADKKKFDFWTKSMD